MFTEFITYLFVGVFDYKRIHNHFEIKCNFSTFNMLIRRLIMEQYEHASC